MPSISDNSSSSSYDSSQWEQQQEEMFQELETQQQQARNTRYQQQDATQRTLVNGVQVQKAVGNEDLLKLEEGTAVVDQKLGTVSLWTQNTQGSKYILSIPLKSATTIEQAKQQLMQLQGDKKLLADVKLAQGDEAVLALPEGQGLIHGDQISTWAGTAAGKAILTFNIDPSKPAVQAPSGTPAGVGGAGASSDMDPGSWLSSNFAELITVMVKAMTIQSIAQQFENKLSQKMRALQVATATTEAQLTQQSAQAEAANLNLQAKGDMTTSVSSFGSAGISLASTLRSGAAGGQAEREFDASLKSDQDKLPVLMQDKTNFEKQAPLAAIQAKKDIDAKIAINENLDTLETQIKGVGQQADDPTATLDLQANKYKLNAAGDALEVGPGGGHLLNDEYLADVNKVRAEKYGESPIGAEADLGENLGLAVGQQPSGPFIDRYAEKYERDPTTASGLKEDPNNLDALRNPQKVVNAQYRTTENEVTKYKTQLDEKNKEIKKTEDEIAHKTEVAVRHKKIDARAEELRQSEKMKADSLNSITNGIASMAQGQLKALQAQQTLIKGSYDAQIKMAQAYGQIMASLVQKSDDRRSAAKQYIDSLAQSAQQMIDANARAFSRS